MYTTNFWDKLYIYRKEIGVLLIILFISNLSFAQEKKTHGMTRGVKNLPYYDDKTFHYGFTIGLNSSRFKVHQSSYFLATDSIIAVSSKGTGGFSLGFVVNYRLASYFDLRLLPTVAFYERKTYFTFANKGKETKLSDGTFIEFPLLMKYKSQRRKNLRMYMTGGAKAGIEAGSKKKDKRASELRTNNFDFSIEYGVGLDIYYPLFKFSPEIRVSHGLINLLNNDPNPYASSINTLTTHTISLYLNFE